MCSHLSRLAQLSLQALLGLLMVTSSGVLTRPAAAQEGKDSKVSVFVSLKPNEKAKPTDEKYSVLRLRPNALQEVFVYVQNDSDRDEKVSVKLFAGTKAEATSDEVTAAKGKATLVTWPPPPPPPAPGAAAPPLQELTGPISLRAVNAKKEPFGEPFSKLFISKPTAYISPRAEYTPEGGRLVATLDRKKDFPFAGPLCPAELVLRPESIRDLVPGARKEGRDKGVLSATNDSLVLERRNLSFRGDRKGFVYLNVDRYNRAFVFEAEFPASGNPTTPQLVTAPVLRANLPEFAPPSADFRVAVEADGAAIEDTDRIKVGLFASSKDGKDEFAEVAEFRGAREEKLRFGTGGRRGVLLFQPEVKDWEAKLDLSGVQGPTKVRLSLHPREDVDKDGKPVPALEVINGATPQRLFTANKVREVVQTITIDGTAPEDVEFLDAPAKAFRGRTLRLKARAKEDVSRVSKTVFYLGKPGMDGKPPPEAITSTGTLDDEEEDEVWSGEFALPANLKGPLHVTFVATNVVDLASKPITLTLDVTDPPATAATVSGKVFDKDAPVDFLPVRLLDAKGKPVAEVRSGDGGKFTFKDLPKGSYKIAALRSTTFTKGELPVTIKGVEEIKDVELILGPMTEQEKEAEANKKLAKIEGLVREGDRVQAGLTVVLSDSNGKQLKTAKTNAEGKYLFEGVLPGTYRVSSSKSASTTKGEQRVEVKGMERKSAPDIKLFR